MYTNDCQRAAVARAKVAEMDNQRPCPPGWVLDAAADRKLNGGFTKKHVKRHGVCGVCFTARTITGACNCP